MRYNPDSNVFSCYSSGQDAITLYPADWCDIDTTPVITISEDERTKDVLSAATSVVFTYEANRYAPIPSISIVSDPDSIIDGEPVVSDGTITVALNPNTESTVKTATLSVSGEGLSSAVTLTINQAAYVNLVSGDETFDLTKKTYSTGDNSVTWAGTSVTINNSGNNATNYLGGDANNRTSSRFYSGNALTITPEAGYTITSVVFTATTASYASVLSGSTWVNANAVASGSTVTVTPTDGTSVISATVSGTCGFSSITVNYLTDGSGSGSGSGSGESTTVAYSAFTLADGVVSGGDSIITILHEQGTGSNAPAYTSPLRIYKDNTLTISCASGYTITGIVFNMNGSYTMGTVAADSGTLQNNSWTGSASSIVFTNNGSQTRIASIEVTYVEG